MPKETLPRKVHNELQFSEKNFRLYPNSILVFDVMDVDIGCRGYVGIKTDKYDIYDEVFFARRNFQQVSDVKIKSKPSSICGYVDLENTFKNLFDVMSEMHPHNEKENLNLYKELVGSDRLTIHLFYKIRVIEMERKQNTSALESALLDVVEFKKSKDHKFNSKSFLKGMAEKWNFRYEKLYSGLQKRRIQKRWAKRDFLESLNKSKD